MNVRQGRGNFGNIWGGGGREWKERVNENRKRREELGQTALIHTQHAVSLRVHTW